MLTFRALFDFAPIMSDSDISLGNKFDVEGCCDSFSSAVLSSACSGVWGTWCGAVRVHRTTIDGYNSGSGDTGRLSATKYLVSRGEGVGVFIAIAC